MTQDKTDTITSVDMPEGLPPGVVFEDLRDQNNAEELVCAAYEAAEAGRMLESPNIKVQAGVAVMACVESFGRELIIIDRATMSAELRALLEGGE